MADPFQFELVAPERLLMSEPVEQVVVPGSEGYFTVLKGHAPFMSTLRPGVVEVTRTGAPERIFVRGGFADVSTNGLTILAERHAVAAARCPFPDVAPEIGKAIFVFAKAAIGLRNRVVRGFTAGLPLVIGQPTQGRVFAVRADTQTVRGVRDLCSLAVRGSFRLICASLRGIYAATGGFSMAYGPVTKRRPLSLGRRRARGTRRARIRTARPRSA